MNRVEAKYTNKVVVIAGGASGIGEQLARQVSKYSKQTIILDRNKKAGVSLANELGDSVTFIKLEMTNFKAVKRVLHDCSKKYGEIDIFFNFAGSFMAGEIRDTPINYWNDIYDSNVKPIINATAAVYAIMQKNGHGHIVNVASSAGLFPVPIMNIYGSTKSAVVSLTLGLKMEAEAFNIQVSVVCPTIVDTPLYDTALYAGVNKAKALNILRNKLNVQTPQQAASQVLKKVAKNHTIIHTSLSTRIGWGVYRLSPNLYMFFAKKYFSSYRQTIRNK